MTWKAISAEFISTLLLMFLGCMPGVPSEESAVKSPMNGAITFGLIVLINIQAFGHISGAHMNPVVTIGAVIWGKMSLALGVAYIIAQYLGSIAGYGILMGVSPVDLVSDGVCTTQPHAQNTVLQVLIIEMILTAALNFLNCAFWDPLNKKSLESVSIKFGLAIAGLSLAGGLLTGASMNPARSFGPALLTSHWNAHWVYVIGPLLGGTISVLFYKYFWLDNTKEEIEQEIQLSST